MPFPSAVTSQQYTDIRKSYEGAAYLALCPNALVFRTQPSAGSLANVYGSIVWATTLAGDYDDVKAGMTYIIHTAENDLRTEIHRGRVRGTEALELLVSEDSFEIETSYYLTVINSYDIAPRLARIVSGTVFLDFDINFHRLPTIINGLQSTYILVGSGAQSISLAPIAVPLEDGATASAWLWDVGDGTITTGTSTTKDITASFPAGHRWVSVRVTDSNSVAFTFRFEVYVGVETSALFMPITSASITADLSGGYNGDVESVRDLTTILNNTRATLFMIERTGADASINTNVAMVGYTQTEDDDATADAQYGVRPITRLSIQGFLSRLASIPAPSIILASVASPSEWGETVLATPNRFVGYMLSMHATYASLSSMKLFDDDAFEFSPLTTSESSLVDATNNMLDSLNGRINTAPSGESELARMADYLPVADRAGVVVVANFITADLDAIALQRPYRQTINQVSLFAGSWRGALPTRIFQGRAPAVLLGDGYEVAELNNQILEANATESDAKTDTGQRAGAHLAYVNPTDAINATLRDSWRFLVPHHTRFYTFTVGSDVLKRGVTFDTTTKWTLQSINLEFAVGGRVNVGATFRRETISTGARVVVAEIPANIESALPVLPSFPEYPSDPSTPLMNFPTLTPSDDEIPPVDNGSIAQVNSPEPPEIADENAGNDNPNCEELSLLFSSPALTATSFNTVIGDIYNISVKGSAGVGSTSAVNNYNFTIGDWSFVKGATNGFSPPSGVYSAGVGWTTEDYTQTDGGLGRAVDIRLTLPVVSNVASMVMTYDLTKGTYSNTGLNAVVLGTDVSSQTVIFTSTVDGNDQTITYAPMTPVSASTLRAVVRPHLDSVARAGSALIKSIELTIVVGGSVNSDAFYSFNPDGTNPQQWLTNGLLIQSIKPTPVPLYSPNHEYDFTFTGDGNPFQFLLNFADYSNNDNLPLIIKVCKP